MQYDVTDEVQQLMDAGFTFEQLVKKAGGALQIMGDGAWIKPENRHITYEATNRSGESAIYMLVSSLEKAPDAPQTIEEPTATTRQVEYLTTLLVRKARSGEGDGFAKWEHYIVDGRIDVKALGALTSAQASQLISSLKGEY